LASVGVLVAVVYAYRDYVLPSGNPEYRLRTYAIAWDKFLQSPVWGQAFLKAASEEFTAYQVGVATQVLPSHSDLLDILANGGMIGSLLWFGGVAGVAVLAYRKILAPVKQGHRWSSFAHTLALCSLGAILVYAFNPVLTAVPPVAYFVWLNLGLLAGLALRADEDAGAAP
jgi:O-antigen ligase